MRGIFFYTIGVGFVCGVLLRSLLVFGIEEIGLVLLLSVACAFVWRIKALPYSSPLFLASLFLLFASLGMLRMDIEVSQQSMMKTYVGKEVLFEGRLVREPEARATSIHLHLAPMIGKKALEERVLVLVDPFVYADTFAYGDVLTVRGTLALPEAFETDTGRVFDYVGYLRAQGIETTVFDGDVVLAREGESSFLRTLYYWKGRFMQSLEGVLPFPHAGLGEGLLLGVKRALGETLEEAFRKTGIIHIVVLSGYNILIVVYAMMYILAYVCRPRTRMVFGLMWVVSFALLVGLSATVVRASIMAGLLLIAQGTGRNYAVLRALMLAGIGMLLINPHLLVYDIGFQLSFVATLGLILFSDFIEKRLALIPNIVGLRGIATATIATQIMVLPLLLYQTGMLSIVSLVVNILVLPMVPPAMLLTFLTGMVGMVSVSLGNILGFIAYGSLNYIIKLAEFFGSLPIAAKTVDAFPFWIVVVAYLGIGLWFLIKVKDKVKEVNGGAREAGLGHAINGNFHGRDKVNSVGREGDLGRGALGHDGIELEEIQISNDYSEWVIEEEKSPKAGSASGDSNLPFR